MKRKSEPAAPPPPPKNPDSVIDIEEELPNGLLRIDFNRPVLVTPHMLGEIQAMLDEPSKDDPDRLKLETTLLAERDAARKTTPEQEDTALTGGPRCARSRGEGDVCGAPHRAHSPVPGPAGFVHPNGCTGFVASARNCPDCDVTPGELHVIGCDVERCAECGGQRIGCSCRNTKRRRLERLPWTGIWPGTVEARELGLTLGGTDPDDGGPLPDLNRLYMECRWDKKARRMVRREETTR